MLTKPEKPHTLRVDCREPRKSRWNLCALSLGLFDCSRFV